jgi:hypothetical protein
METSNLRAGQKFCVRSDILMELVMKTTFWDVWSCSLAEVSLTFEGM